MMNTFYDERMNSFKSRSERSTNRKTRARLEREFNNFVTNFKEIFDERFRPEQSDPNYKLQYFHTMRLNLWNLVRALTCPSCALASNNKRMAINNSNLHNYEILQSVKKTCFKPIPQAGINVLQHIDNDWFPNYDDTNNSNPKRDCKIARPTSRIGLHRCWAFF
ncbi:unnamed protein product [Rhizophagus irregularis]|nr:unnamed protein product [Rhizophagus irregularis]CAB5379276.1 unnamed protein product [Rhizophagus irregularis]